MSVYLMISHFSKKFKKNNRPSDTVSSISGRSLDNLKTLIEKKTRLFVKAEDCRQLFQSMVLSVDEINKTILIDELFPQPEIKLLADQTLYFESHDNGSTTSFSSTVITDTRSNGLPALLLNLPDVIKLEQRRNNFRLQLRNNQPVSAKLFQNHYDALSGMVKDISNHGLRINLTGNQTDELQHGDILQHCEINLDEMNQIECQLTVRSKRYFSRPYRHTQIGTEITDIKLKHRDLLTHYVTRQQRMQCRQRADSRL